MEELGIIVLRGAGIGAVYSLIAFALNSVFNASSLVNLAQGHILLLGGYFAVATVTGTTPGLLWVGLALAAAAVVAMLAAAQGSVTLLPLTGGGQQWNWMVTTLAAALIIDGTLLLVVGPHTQSVPPPIGQVSLAGVSVPGTYLLAIVLAVLVFVVLDLFHRRTLTGLALSAMAQDLDAAQAAGVRVRRQQVTAFAISGAILGITGFVSAPVLEMRPGTGLLYLVNGFIAMVFGGMGRNLGALICGPVIGVLTMTATYRIGGIWGPVVSVILLALVLLTRPQGIFGNRQARVV